MWNDSGFKTMLEYEVAELGDITLMFGDVLCWKAA